MGSTCAGRRPDSTVHGPCQCPSPARCRGRHHGRRRWYAALPADEGPLKAGVPGWQIPPRRHYKQLHQFRAAPRLRPEQFNSSSPTATSRTRTASTSSPRFVEILAAQQTPDRVDWYQGTADAVRQNSVHPANYPHRLVLILRGPALSRWTSAPSRAAHATAPMPPLPRFRCPP
jgi:hypothetical protein